MSAASPSPVLDVVNALTPPVLVVGFVIELLVGPVYALQFYVILRRGAKRLSGFYLLFIYRAILAFLQVYDANFCNRLPSLNLFFDAYKQLPEFVYTFSWALQPVIFYGDYLCNLAMLANRYTAIAHPFKNKKIWQPKLTLLYILVFTAMVLPFGVPFFRFKQCIWQTSDGKMFVVDNCPIPEGESDPNQIFTDNNALFSTIFLVASTALNLATWRAYKNGPMGESNNASDNARLERKLTVYSVLTIAGYAIQATYYIGIWWLFHHGGFDATMIGFVQLVLPISIDLFSFGLPALLLVWASDELRQDMRQLVCGHTATTSSVVVPSTNAIFGVNVAANANARIQRNP